MLNFNETEPVPTLTPYQTQTGNSASYSGIPYQNSNFIHTYQNDQNFSCITPDSFTSSADFLTENDQTQDNGLFYVPPSVVYPTSASNPDLLYGPDFCIPGNSSTLEPEVPDFSDACLKFMNEILDEDLDGFQDCHALQETEKSLYDALGQTNPFQPTSIINHNHESPSEDHNGSTLHSSSPNNTFDDATTNGPSGSPTSTLLVEDLSAEAGFDWFIEASKYVRNGSVDPDGTANLEGTKKSHGLVDEEIHKWVDSVINGRYWGGKNHPRDESEYEDVIRSSKQSASCDEDDEDLKQYDDALLYKDEKCESSGCTNGSSSENGANNTKGSSKGSKGRRRRTKKQISEEDEYADLSTLLIHCAQAVSSFDIQTANEQLKQIRQHSSIYGSSIQRVAHYFADGLEARMKGTGSVLSSDLLDKKISSSSILRAYQMYVTAIPFKRMSYSVANQTIGKVAENATSIHIIDFGIFCGFQWPCFIQYLSERPNGPPRLRITGIDIPQRGFRPAKLVEETGRRLARYCERFNVPFEYHPIAQKFETIIPEDLKINKDELLVVNCLYRSRGLFDETVEVKSPRDAFLKLIRKLNPELFIHGVVNGSFNAPFFATRFKEALFHFSCVFDLIEATIPREDEGRLFAERELYGKSAVNVIACEGTERVERPETYRQWQVRLQKAGFRAMPLYKDIVNRVSNTVEANYHRDFVVGEDSNWLFQGWKGRILYAVSCWKPAK